MAENKQVQPTGERLRKAVKWISEVQLEKPDKERIAIIHEAQIRFNLTPKECCFLENNFSKV